MNIISNNCIGGYFYKKNKWIYANPFIWSSCYGDSLDILMDEYSNINFDNYVCNKNDETTFYILIDNKIKVQFIHYIMDETCKNIVVDEPNVSYCKIQEYIIEKYKKRVQRLKESAELPIFLIDWWGTYLHEHGDWLKVKPNNETDYFNMFLEKKFKYKTIIMNPYIKGIKKLRQNLYVVYDEIISFNNGDPKGLIERHNTDILSIIEGNYE